MKNKNLWFFVSILMIFSQFINGETNFLKKHSISVYFTLQSPQGAFKENYPRQEKGFQLDYLYRLGNSTFSVGGSLALEFYGKEKDVLYETAKIDRDKITYLYDLTHINFKIRFQPTQNRRINPYMEVMAGILAIKTQYHRKGVTEETEDGDGTRNKWSSLKDSSSFNYGLGAGMQIDIFNLSNSNKPSKSIKILLDLSAQYLFGGRGNYIIKGSVVYNGSDFSYIEKNSSINVLNLNIGLAFLF